MNYTWEKTGCRKYIIIITATCTDTKSGIAKVEFYLNGELQKTLTGNGPEYVWSFEYNPLPSRVIKGIAYDKAGNLDFTELQNPTCYVNQQSQSLSRTVVKVVNQ
jgi:hypothetical protein